LKKIQDKKKVIRAKDEILRLERKRLGEEQEAANLLEEGHDEDLLF